MDEKQLTDKDYVDTTTEDLYRIVSVREDGTPATFGDMIACFGSNELVELFGLTRGVAVKRALDIDQAEMRTLAATIFESHHFRQVWGMIVQAIDPRKLMEQNHPFGEQLLQGAWDSVKSLEEAVEDGRVRKVESHDNGPFGGALTVEFGDA